ncbi:MAG: chemotaxis protein CheW [Gammaproteobacteria bacterium]|nr:MAG: chemotaxis protein CheW [Gammaproteobacteria bacterium]
MDYREFLVFRLANEEYAIDVLKIQEIKHYETAVIIANAPEFIKGFMNTREAVIPLIDMRILFHLPYHDYDKFTVVITLALEKQRLLGIVTDGVIDVIKLTADQVKTTPEFSTIIHSDYIQGIGLIDKRNIILVDIEKLCSSFSVIVDKLSS